MAWVTTQGKVLAARINHSAHASGGNNIHSYRPVIQYEYEVGGVTYTGSRATESDIGVGSRAEVEKFINARPPGALVTVHYNSANPADSFLEKGAGGLAKGGIKLALGIGALALGLVLIMACAMLVVFAASVGIVMIPLLDGIQ